MTDIVGQAARVLYEHYSRSDGLDVTAQESAQALADAGLLAEPATSILEEFVVPCPRCNPVEGRCMPCRKEAGAYYRAAINAISTYSAAKELAHDGDSDAGGYVGRDLRELAEHIKQHLLEHPEPPARTVPTRERIALRVREIVVKDYDFEMEKSLHIADAVLALLADQPTVEEVKAEAWEEGAQAAWLRTGDGWNGEYAEGTHDGSRSFRDCNPDTPNPYRTQDGK